MSAHSWVIPPGWGKPWCPSYVGKCWVIQPGWGKLCYMVSLLHRQMYHSLSLLWVHILGSFNQVGPSFVTLVSLLLDRCTIHYPYSHSWVIPPGWVKLCDMVSLLDRCTIHYPYYECTFLGHSTRLGLCDTVSLLCRQMYHSLSSLWVHILGSFHQVGASFVTP